MKKLPKHIQDTLDSSLERDRKSGNDFWTTPMTKEKLAPITAQEWEEAWRLVAQKNEHPD